MTFNESVIIAAKLTDTVSRVNFEDGQMAAAGDVLVELTNLEQAALLDEAEANVQDARNQAWKALPHRKPITNGLFVQVQLAN